MLEDCSAPDEGGQRNRDQSWHPATAPAALSCALCSLDRDEALALRVSDVVNILGLCSSAEDCRYEWIASNDSSQILQSSYVYKK